MIVAFVVIWKDDQFAKHLPRYCRDLKQILDDKASTSNENSTKVEITRYGPMKELSRLKKS
jgi:hypothetical protein